MSDKEEKDTCPKCESVWWFFRTKNSPIIREKEIIAWRKAKHWTCGTCGHEQVD